MWHFFMHLSSNKSHSCFKKCLAPSNIIATVYNKGAQTFEVEGKIYSVILLEGRILLIFAKPWFRIYVYIYDNWLWYYLDKKNTCILLLMTNLYLKNNILQTKETEFRPICKLLPKLIQCEVWCCGLFCTSFWMFGFKLEVVRFIAMLDKEIQFCPDIFEYLRLTSHFSTLCCRTKHGDNDNL